MRHRSDIEACAGLVGDVNACMMAIRCNTFLIVDIGIMVLGQVVADALTFHDPVLHGIY